MVDTPRQYFERRISGMELERTSWDKHWKDLLRNFSPRKGLFFTTDRNRGNPKNDLTNNTPLYAKRILRSGLMTGITSPARPWFMLLPPDPGLEDFKPVREWLDQVQQLMYRIFTVSNLYQQLPLVYEEASVIGTAAMLEEEDFDTMARFTTYTAGEYWLDINGSYRVDTFAREYELTVYQLVEQFGLDNVSRRISDAYDRGDYDNTQDVYHYIEPVDARDLDDEQFDLDEQFEFRSIIWEKGRGEDEGNEFLDVSGYREFPIMAPRWDAKAGDVYGYSAAMDALGDAKALQIKEKEKGKAIAKQVAPPTKAPSALKNKVISLLPGGNTFVDDPNHAFTAVYQVNARIDELVRDIQVAEERINRALYADLFMLISHEDNVRTATEIAIRQEEKLLQLGPVLESLHDELLDPLIDRTFSIIMKEAQRGWEDESVPMLLPPPPQELQDQDLKIQYISVLAQAQRAVSTNAIDRWIGFTGNLSQFKPEALMRVNADETTKYYAEQLGVPSSLVASDDEVQAQLQAQLAQQQADQLQTVVETGSEAAKNMSEADTTGGNALSDMLGR